MGFYISPTKSLTLSRGPKGCHGSWTRFCLNGGDVWDTDSALYPSRNNAPIQNLFPWKTRTKTWLGQGMFYSGILTQKNYQQMKKHTSSLRERRAIQNFIKKLNGTLPTDPLRELRSSYYRYSGWTGGPWTVGPTVGDFSVKSIWRVQSPIGPIHSAEVGVVFEPTIICLTH